MPVQTNIIALWNVNLKLIKMKYLYLLEEFDVLSYSGSIHNLHMPYPLGFTLLQNMLEKDFAFNKL